MRPAPGFAGHVSFSITYNSTEGQGARVIPSSVSSEGCGHVLSQWKVLSTSRPEMLLSMRAEKPGTHHERIAENKQADQKRNEHSQVPTSGTKLDQSLAAKALLNSELTIIITHVFLRRQTIISPVLENATVWSEFMHKPLRVYIADLYI